MIHEDIPVHENLIEFEKSFDSMSRPFILQSVTILWFWKHYFGLGKDSKQ